MIEDKMKEYNIGDLISDFLFENNLNTVFGVVSVHNIPILDAIAKRNLIKFIPARGEMGAGHMADGFARSSNNVGVVVTSTGPGAANVVGALVEARFAGTPLLHITGQTATQNLDKQQGTVHDVPNQLEMMKSVSKKAYRISSSKDVLDVLEKALEDAITPPTGPVSIEVPIDIQRTIIKKQKTFSKVHIKEKNIPLGDLNSLDLIEEQIRKSKRKILWIGNGAKKLNFEVSKFVELGFAVVTSTQGRGVIDENHDMCLGSFNAIPKAEKFYSSLDLMIVVGSRLRGHETKDMSLVLPDNLLQIDIDPNAKNRTYSSKIFHLGDGKKVLENLYKRFSNIGIIDKNWINEVKSLKKEIKKDYKEFLQIYGEFPEIIERNLPKNARWIRDVTISNSTWGNRLMPVQKWYQNIYPVGAGIGPGMSLGIGASLATEEKIKSIAMCGDGGFMLNISELWTAVEINSNIIFMVMNDKGYGVIKHIQDSLYGGRKNFADLQVPNFKELADTVKMKYLIVKSSSEFENSLKKAFNLSGPILLEIDINSIGELPRYFIPPPFTEK
tara:strand:+ start:439 stop:2106 length:1668 start_codon:yes stop_codon:yes gene_type:complete